MRKQEDIAEMQRGKQRGREEKVEGGTQTENEQTYIINLSGLKSAEKSRLHSKIRIAHEQHHNLYTLDLE